MVAMESETEPLRNAETDSEFPRWGRFSESALQQNDTPIRGRSTRRANPASGDIASDPGGQVVSLSANSLPVAALGVLALLAGIASLRAQPVMAPPLQDLSVLAAASGLESPNQLSMPSASGSVLAPPKGPSNAAPFNYGTFEIRPHFSYRLTYGNGLQFQPGTQGNTALQEISVGFSTKLADGLTVEYAAIQSLYSEPHFTDALNHSFSLNGGKEKRFSIGGWAMGFTQGFNTSFEPQIETGKQTKQQSALTGLSAAYPFARVFSLSLGVKQNLRFTSEPEGDAFEWSTMNWLNVQATSKVNAGIGLGLGTVDLTVGPNQTYQRFMARAGWKVSSKVGLDFDAGLEPRDSGGTAGAATNPIFNVNLAYRPFEYTSLALSASQTFGVSLFQNQTQQSKTWSVSLSQRLLGKVNFNASTGQSRSSFTASTLSLAPAREDVIKNLGLGIGVAFRRRGSISASYSRRSNGTNIGGFGFSSSQYGLTIGFRY
jgi:hypothetical protein